MIWLVQNPLRIVFSDEISVIWLVQNPFRIKFFSWSFYRSVSVSFLWPVSVSTPVPAWWAFTALVILWDSYFDRWDLSLELLRESRLLLLKSRTPLSRRGDDSLHSFLLIRLNCRRLTSGRSCHIPSIGLRFADQSFSSCGLRVLFIFNFKWDLL